MGAARPQPTDEPSPGVPRVRPPSLIQSVALSLSMTSARNLPCHDKQQVGNLLWHEAQFRGPDAAAPCELPEGQLGDVDHTFINRSIYWHTFTTNATAHPSALQIAGPTPPPPVHVAPAKRGALRATPSTGN